MKKYTKWLVSALCALTLVTTAFAADTASPTAKPESIFNSGEFGLTLGTGYTLDKSALFKQDYTLNLNAGAFYFPFRYAGVEVNVPFYQTKGVAVDEVQFGTLFRLPLAKTTPLFRNLSPYIGIGGVYNWQLAQDWAYIGKAGLEFRINKKWGVFAEYQYRNYELKSWDRGQNSLAGGLKLVF